MGKAGKKKKLTPKQLAFCPQYVKRNNGTKAAQAVSPKLSDKVAASQAEKWLRKTEVCEEITRLRKELEKKALMGAEEVERLLDLCIRANPKKYVNEIGITKGMHELTENEAFAVESIDTWEKETKDGGLLGGTSLKLLNKTQLFKLKMQRLGMLKDGADRVADTFEKWLDTIKTEKGK